MRTPRLKEALVAAWLAWSLPALAAGRELPFSDGQWSLEGKGTLSRPTDARDTFAVESAFAERRDVSFDEGTIEFDVTLTRRRSFVYVSFRIHDDGTREEFYLRPHKSSLPDSIQYAPVYQEESAWQLHHGPGGTAAVAFEPGALTHVKVVVSGTRAALFVGGADQPVLIVPRLCGRGGPGRIGVGGYSPPGTSGDGPIAVFSKLSVRPEADAVDWSKGPTFDDPGPGTIRTWALSPAFVAPAGGLPALPPALAAGPWTSAGVEPEQGLLALDRHVKRPAGKDVRSATAAARVHVKAASAGVRVLDLGFSDVATVFLNGTPLFTGDASYSFDRPRRDGVIGLDQARLYLPLRAGDNELVVVVSDSFGGWGLMGCFADPNGLTIEAR